MRLIPMKSPRGTNFERLFIPAGGMAYDAQPASFRRSVYRRALDASERPDLETEQQLDPEEREDNPNIPRAGDEDDDDEMIAEIMDMLAEKLSPDDMDELKEMVDDARLRRRTRAADRRRGRAQDQPPSFRGRPRLAGDSALRVEEQLERLLPGYARLKRCY